MDKLRKILIRLLACFILSKKKRDKFRKLSIKRIDADLSQNSVCIPAGRDIFIKIIGKNNKIEIDKDCDKSSKIKIQITGDNNVVKIAKANTRLNLAMGSLNDQREIYNSSFIFGKSCSAGLSCIMMENNTSINIGNDCLFSWEVEFRCTDDHVILNENDEVVNLAKSIEIGNHVWIGKDVLVLKNSVIPDGCIIGAKSVIAKKFTKKNAVIVGNPARVVKENIHWKGDRPDKYANANTLKNPA